MWMGFFRNILRIYTAALAAHSNKCSWRVLVVVLGFNPICRTRYVRQPDLVDAS